MTGLLLFDPDGAPESGGFADPVVEAFIPRLRSLDQPAGDDQDTKADPDPAVDVPKFGIELVGDGPGLILADAYAFLRELVLDNGDIIAGPEERRGQEDYADSGADKDDKGPMPEADRPGMGLKKRMRVHKWLFSIGRRMKVINIFW